MKNIVTLRKILLWFMILSLLFLISSCAKQSEEEMVQETEEQTFEELTDAVESTEKATQSKPKNSFSVTYRIYQSGILKTEKKKVGKLGTPVTFDLPETPLGYVYGAWDDGSTDARRVDTEESDGKIYTINCVPEYLGVPTIEISTADGGGITSKTSYKKCTVTLSNFDKDGCFENLPAQIRGRGNSSWSYPKKGFRIKFDEQIKMLGSDYKTKNWVFISNYGDKSLLRNMIAYDLSSAFNGLDYTTTHKFIDVYLDGEYYGLFMMCDKIDVGSGRVEYDKKIYSDPEKVSYIVEIGATDPGEEGVEHFRCKRDHNKRYSLIAPDIDDAAYDPDVHLTYIEDYFDRCLKALEEKDWETINELMDIDSFIDYYIIQELYMNKDCFWRSVHFIKEPNGKLYAGPVWDMDQGAGNVDGFFGEGVYDTTPDIDIDYAESTHTGKTAGTLWIAAVNIWYKHLFQNEEFVQLLREHLVEYRPIFEQIVSLTVTDGSVENSYYSLYGEAMKRNFEKWQIMGASVWPNTPILKEIKTVEGQIDYLHDWLLERYDVICKYYGVST